MEPQLSRGCLARIWNNEQGLGDVLVQTLDMKPVAGGSSPRLRIEVTDLNNRARAMIGTQMYTMASAEVRPGRILKLREYVVNIVSNKRVFIILNFEVLGDAPIPAQPPPLLESTIHPTRGPAITQTNGTSQNVIMPQNQNYPPRPSNPPPISAPRAAPEVQMSNNNSHGHQHAQYGYGSMPPGQQGYVQANPPSAQASFGGYGQRQQTGVHGSYSLGGQQESTRVQPSYSMNTGPVVRNEAPSHITSINHLNPYMNRWTILGRCTSKADLRRWSNSRGEGKVFSFDLLDKSGDIRITAFNDQAEEFDPIIEVGCMYSVSKGSLKPKRPQYNHTGHDFEISLERTSRIERVEETKETEEIPHVQFQIKDILSVQQMEKGKIIDVVGVVEKVEPWTMISKKNGEETSKRPLIIRDKTNCEIELTLWGDSQAGKVGDLLNLEIEAGRSPIIAVKSARVGDFNGKSLSTIASTQIVTNPDIPEAHALSQWYQGGGRQMVASSLSNQRTSGMGAKRIHCADVPSQISESGGKPAYVEFVAPIVFIRRENMYYPACTKEFSSRPCNKKLREETTGWYCERCMTDSTPEWRYLLSIAVKDHTGMQYLTAFGNDGTQIMGKTADEIKDLEKTEEFEEAINRAQFNTRKFVVKIFEDVYNDEARVKTTVVRQEAMDPVKESQLLLQRIKKYLGGNAAPSISNPNTGIGTSNLGGGGGGGGNPYSNNPGYHLGSQQQYGWSSTSGVGSALGGGRPFF